MLNNQGRNMAITHDKFDEYKYLNYGEMLELSRKQGYEEGNEFTQNILAQAIGRKLGDSRYEEKF